MASVFAMQGFGILFAGVVSFVTLLAFRPLILSNSQNLDYVWRIFIGVDVQGNVEKGEIESEYRIVIQKATWKDFIHHFGQWENGKVLLGTSVTWFAHDIAYYGIGLNNAIILEAIGYVKTDDAYQSLFNISIGNIVITLMGTIPGYWFTVFLVDSLGRKYIQLQGFALLTIIFIIMGEVFPTRYRSTCHGISAASDTKDIIIDDPTILSSRSIRKSRAWYEEDDDFSDAS
ncbi:22851_t:CDS:2 [Rhizophagus irregularis]|nr:22851_t:CDS:2 [Rhizophagus irregularis]